MSQTTASELEDAVPTLWGLIGSILAHGQSFFVYPAGFLPHPRHVDEPTRYGIPFTLLELPTPDGVTIHAHLMLFSLYRDKKTEANRYRASLTRMHVWPESGRGTVMMFHGNAMNHGEHVDLAEEFLKMGLNVVTMSYRGYGNSTGTPSEAGLRIDSQTTLNHLLQHELLSKLPIVLYGQSLGGAVATDLAYKNPGKISALILENTFLSIPILVKDFPAPFRSFPFLCTQKWPSVERIQWIPRETPILMLGGDADMVVRPRHMQGLWAVARERVSLGDLVVEEDERETETEKNALGDGEVPACFPGLGSSVASETIVTPSPSSANSGDGAAQARPDHRYNKRSSHYSSATSDGTIDDDGLMKATPGCFSYLTRSTSMASLRGSLRSGQQGGAGSKGKLKLKLRPPTEILKGLEVQYGSVHMRNGKDVFRLFERRTHVNTCRGHEYWPTVRAFLDSNFGLPTSDSGKGSSAPSAAAAAAAAVSTPRTSTSGVHSRPLSSVASSSPVTAIVTVTATTTSAGLGAETAPSSAQVPTSAPST